MHIQAYLQCFATNFVALEHENQKFLKTLQQVNIEKSKQHKVY